MEIVSLKCDYCFKEWFSNETVRKYFISDVLDIPVESIRSVRLANTFLRRRYREQKQGILDVLVELNDDTKINIEMQTKFMSCWDKRDLFYLAKMYTEDLKVGERYSKLKRCVGISILDFNLTEDESYHRVYRLRDESGHEFSDLLEVHIIELGKKLKGTEKVDDWIRLINAKSTEELNMIGGKNVGIKTAIEEIKE
ncbi:MAG: Rpn family recombination-promoting nuclease/putative transposase, partial [Lachnospiraceae bacterium]